MSHLEPEVLDMLREVVESESTLTWWKGIEGLRSCLHGDF